MNATRRLMRLLLAIAMTAGLILAQAGAAQATFSGRDGRIAFWDFMTGQIYAVNPDGTGLVQLTHVAQGQTAADPAWSPDGRHVACDSDMSGAPRLWIMAANGRHAHMVAGDRASAADFLPSYTPDGDCTPPSSTSGPRYRPTAGRSPSPGSTLTGSVARST